MKKYKIKKSRRPLSVIMSSALLINLLFLPPFLPKKKFQVTKKETIEVFENKEQLKEYKTYLENRKKKNSPKEKNNSKIQNDSLIGEARIRRR